MFSTFQMKLQTEHIPTALPISAAFFLFKQTVLLHPAQEKTQLYFTKSCISLIIKKKTGAKKSGGLTTSSSNPKQEE